MTSTSGLPSAKTLRLASARRRLRAFIDQIAELGTSDFAHLDGKDALTFIKGYSLELREVLERLTPEASEASVNEACAQTSLMVSRYTDILGFILRSTNVRNAFEMHFPLKRLVETAVSPDARLIMSSEWKFVPFTYPMTLDWLPGFALVGGPAPESDNVLIVPLAGHEIGHSAWRSKQLKDQLMADLVAAIAQTLDDMPAETSLVSNELGVDGVALAKLRDAVLRSAIKQLEEIFCDLFGLFIFGRSFLYAYEYFLAPGWGMRSAYYPSSLDRVRYLIEAAEKLGIAPEADLFEAWGDSIPLKFADGAVIRLADAAVAKIYPALRAITFNILADHGITPPTADATDRVLASLRQHVPDGEGATLPEIVTAGWLLLRERGGLSLEQDIAEYKILNELMLKSVEVSEFKLRVEAHA